MPLSVVTRGRTPQVKRLSAEEVKDRWERDLCFNYDEKYIPGHQCAKLLWMEVVTTEDGPALDELKTGTPELSIEGEEDVPAISLHAIFGLQGPHTMRVKGWIGHSKVVLLVDSGSTHNFFSLVAARRASLILVKERNLDVVVANREKMTSGEICKGVFIRLGKALF
jgi:hypothetical protein